MKVALITGSGRKRIGWHVAGALAERGYSVALHYHSSAADAEQSVAAFKERGVDAASFAADLTDEIQVRGLVESVKNRFGQIDVLVNCAAIWKPKRLEEVIADDVREHFDTNLLGTFLCCQQVGLMMVAQPDGGAIVNIGDWAAVRPYCNYAAYFASKGAIPALTRTMAVELGTRNPKVRVNCVLPGPVMLPLDLPEAERKRAVEATLVQHEGTPENVVQAVLYLIDNDFVAGDSITVDGGRSIYARGN
jgi:pteridine reductase